MRAASSYTNKRRVAAETKNTKVNYPGDVANGTQHMIAACGLNMSYASLNYLRICACKNIPYSPPIIVPPPPTLGDVSVNLLASSRFNITYVNTNTLIAYSTRIRFYDYQTTNLMSLTTAANFSKVVGSIIQKNTNNTYTVLQGYSPPYGTFEYTAGSPRKFTIGVTRLAVNPSTDYVTPLAGTIEGFVDITLP